MNKEAIIFAAFVAAVSCSPAWRVEAEYCAAIRAHGRAESEVLAAEFDAFASENGMAIDKSNPAARDYSNSDATYVAVSFGMGDHGTKNAGEKILRNLEGFVQDRIARRYRVRLCKDIPGFKSPSMIR